MNLNKILYWSPRVLGIIFILFLGLFAFDVFGTGEPVWAQALGFLIHLIPNFILAAVLVLAWKNELVGGATFFIAAVVFLAFFRNDWPEALIIEGPLFLIGGLFLVHHFYQERRKV